MMVGGRQVALTTGLNVQAMKDNLLHSYFHLPGAKPAKKKRSRK